MTTPENPDLAATIAKGKSRRSAVISALNRVLFRKTRAHQRPIVWKNIKSEMQGNFFRLFEAGNKTPKSLSVDYVNWAIDLHLWSLFVERRSGKPFPYLDDEPSKDCSPSNPYHREFDEYCRRRIAREKAKKVSKAKVEDVGATENNKPPAAAKKNEAPGETLAPAKESNAPLAISEQVTVETVSEDKTPVAGEPRVSVIARSHFRLPSLRPSRPHLPLPLKFFRDLSRNSSFGTCGVSETQ